MPDPELERRWEILTAADASRAVGEVVLTRRAKGADEGETLFTALVPEGQGWVDVVAEFVTGSDVTLVAGDEHWIDPHDRNLGRLAGVAAIMYLRRVSIRNVKCFERLSLDFSTGDGVKEVDRPPR